MTQFIALVMDSRLLRISSHDAVSKSVDASGAGFTVNLGNVLSQIQADVYGYSVESVGFSNIARNVQLNISDRISMSVNGFLTTLIIPPGQYTFSEFLVAFNNADPSMVADEFPVGSGHIRITWLDGLPRVFYGEGAQESNQLATMMGFLPKEQVNVSAVTGFTGYRLTNHVNFGGERIAFLHSDSLTHNKHSIDGEGLALSFSCSFPITVPYGSFQLVYPNQYRSSVVTWDHTHEIREINLRLRNIRGHLMDLQGTEWFVVLRLFLL